MSDFHLWSPLSWQRGYSVDKSRCRVSVHPGRGVPHQCQKKPTVFECIKGEQVGFCAVHSPAAQARRDQAQQEKYARRSEGFTRAYQTDAALHACKAALEQIAAGHNDPRALAAEVLALFPPSPIRPNPKPNAS